MFNLLIINIKKINIICDRNLHSTLGRGEYLRLPQERKTRVEGIKKKGKDFESYGNIKARTLSPIKDKGKDFESYRNIKVRMLSPMKNRDRGH